MFNFFTDNLKKNLEHIIFVPLPNILLIDFNSYILILEKLTRAVFQFW
jgi:hypothetical protein